MKRSKSQDRTDPAIITVRVPLSIRKRGGRKLVLTPANDSIPATPQPRRSHDALTKALARAFRWRREIEDGEYASITELAKASGVNQSYACRLLRITVLSPEIVSAVIEEKSVGSFTLKQLSRPMPLIWPEQISALRG